MADYLHGAYGEIQTVGSRDALKAPAAIVYVGTAPVYTLEGGASNVNKPVVVENMAEARKKFGWANDWASYTLCEAMQAHLNNSGVGPIILINVLDPAVHKTSTGGTASVTPANGMAVLTGVGDMVLDSLVVKSGGTTKVKGVDYAVRPNYGEGKVTLVELTAGSLGSTALTCTYDKIDVSAVDSDDVIGTTDNAGTNTGLYALKDVYTQTGYIPAFIGCPGFSAVAAVNTAMCNIAQKISNHWNAYCFADLPLIDSSTPITMTTAATYKEAHGYNRENESVYFPMVTGTDNRKYHLSVLAAANFLSLLYEYDGIPYHTASNTEISVTGLYMGEGVNGVYDDDVINKNLNRNGINSACFVGGRWVVWGAHSADYSPATADDVNVAETNRMMLYYVSNDFQHRRPRNVDKPVSKNDLETIVSEEQTRLDALNKIGAILYGTCAYNAELDSRSDIMAGDFSFEFNITTTPQCKSLTAVVNWTDAGFDGYFGV